MQQSLYGVFMHIWYIYCIFGILLLILHIWYILRNRPRTQVAAPRRRGLAWMPDPARPRRRAQDEYYTAETRCAAARRRRPPARRRDETTRRGLAAPQTPRGLASPCRRGR